MADQRPSFPRPSAIDASCNIAYPALNSSSKGEITITLPMTPTITAFKRSPDGGKGHARSLGA
jgi:hypothetical protein